MANAGENSISAAVMEMGDSSRPVSALFQPALESPAEPQISAEDELHSCVDKEVSGEVNLGVGMASAATQPFCRGRPGAAPPRPPPSAAPPARPSHNAPRPALQQLTCPTEKFRLKNADFDNIVSYLEVPEHFSAVTGAGRKTKVGGKYQNKTAVFKAMLAVLQHHGFPKEINAANLMKRYQRYVKRYKDALKVKNQSGGGLTEEEQKEGIILVEKLNRLCPFFDRMDAVFGARANVAPRAEADVGVEEDVDYYMDGECGENDLDSQSQQENTNPNFVDLINSESGCAANPYTPTVVLTGKDVKLISFSGPCVCFSL